MATRIKPKRGTGAPTTGDLETNEIAMDTGAKKLYVHDGTNVVTLAENITNNDTDDLSEGSTNLYYTTARHNTDFDTKLAAADTDDLSEGSTNLYYTDARAQAVSINTVVEDTTPQLGGNLDLNSNNIDGTGNIDITGALTLSGDITGDSGDLNILNSVNGNSIVFKTDDAGGTAQTGLTVGTDDYTDTNDDTQYKSFIQNTGGGLKVGSGEFSSTGNTPDNGSADYEFNGVIVEPTGNSWPVMKIFSTGESTGKNPVYDRLGLSFLQQYPQSVIQLGASEGTVANQSAITSGKRIGQLAFAVHDGSRLGGTNSISSATITTTAIEDAATTNARAVKMTIDFLKEGGTASDGDASSDRSEVLAMQENRVTMKPGGEYGLEIDGDGVKPFRFFGVAAGGTDPSDPNDGDWFFNTTDLDLKRYNDGAGDWDIYTDEGWAFYDTTNNRFLVRQGTDWKPITLGTALT